MLSRHTGASGIKTEAGLWAAKYPLKPPGQELHIHDVLMVSFLVEAYPDVANEHQEISNEGQTMKLSKMFDHWREVRSGLLAALDNFSDDELAFKPFASSWSAGQIMLHIAGSEEGWFRYVIERKYEQWPPEYSLEVYPAVADIRALLSEVHVRTEAYLGTLDLADLERIIHAPWGKGIPLGWILWHVLEHEIHHRGELSLILGLLGREGLDV